MWSLSHPPIQSSSTFTAMPSTAARLTALVFTGAGLLYWTILCCTQGVALPWLLCSSCGLQGVWGQQSCTAQVYCQESNHLCYQGLFINGVRFFIVSLSVNRLWWRTPGQPWGGSIVNWGTRPGTVLYCTVLYCTVLYYTVLYYTILYCTILYYTVLYCTILYYTVLYCTILSALYCTVRTVVYCTRVVVWGHSLGSAIATHMVADFDLETGTIYSTLLYCTVYSAGLYYILYGTVLRWQFYCEWPGPRISFQQYVGWGNCWIENIKSETGLYNSNFKFKIKTYKLSLALVTRFVDLQKLVI